MSHSEISHDDGRVELTSHAVIATSALYNHDLAPVRVADRNWSAWDFAALCIDGALHSDLHDGVELDWQRHELVASAADDLVGQSHRVGADFVEFTSGDQVRDSVSGFCAGRVWHARCEFAGADARRGGVWLVWDSGVDRWVGAAYIYALVVAGVANAAW